MFGWFRKKPAHPLADLDATRAQIATLAGVPPQQALARIGEWLDSLTAARELELEARWKAVDLLDQAAAVPRRRLMQESVSPARTNKPLEEQRSAAALAFWQSQGAAYARCLTTLRSVESEAARLAKNATVLIAARALRATAMQLKWTYLRHVQAEPRIWQALGGAYQFAETKGIVGLRAEL